MPDYVKDLFAELHNTLHDKTDFTPVPAQPPPLTAAYKKISKEDLINQHKMYTRFAEK